MTPDTHDTHIHVRDDREKRDTVVSRNYGRSLVKPKDKYPPIFTDVGNPYVEVSIKSETMN